MTITSGLFNSVNGDRKYNSEWFARYFALFIGNGVFPNPSSGLQVTEEDNMTTTVRPGDGWINGYFIVNDSDYVLQHEIADGLLKRIDRIVMRLDYFKREIEVVIKKGAFASTPVAPALQRNGDAYELAIADVLINNGMTQITQAQITDTRLNSDLCGIVHGTVDQVDTTTLFNQYQSWLNQQQLDYETDFLTWSDQKRDDFDTWQGMEQADFDAWFLNIQDILDENVAANLQLQINQLVLDIATVDGKVDAVNGALTSHLADYVKHPGYGIAGGTANAITVNLVPAPTAYKDGMGIAIKITAQNTGATTVNVNGLGTKSLRKANGNTLTSGSHKVGGIYPYRYNETTGNFIAQGEGGEYGTAIASDVREGKTFGTENGVVNGAFVGYGSGEEIPIDLIAHKPLDVQPRELIRKSWSLTPKVTKQSMHINPERQELLYCSNDGMEFKRIRLSDFAVLAEAMVRQATNYTPYFMTYDATYDALYMTGTNYELARVNTITGAKMWETTSGQHTSGDIAAVNPLDGGLYSLRATSLTRYGPTGEKLWNITIPGGFMGNYAGGADKDGNLYLMRFPNSTAYVLLYKIDKDGVIKVNGAQYLASTYPAGSIGYGKIEVDSRGWLYWLSQSHVTVLYPDGPNYLVARKHDQAQHVQIDSEDNYYVTEPNNYQLNQTGLTKFDKNGNKIWGLTNAPYLLTGGVSDFAIDESIEYPNLTMFTTAAPQGLRTHRQYIELK